MDRRDGEVGDRAPVESREGPAGDEDAGRVGEGLGGMTGAAAGAAVGSLGGPVGAVIGAVAGAVGGWWAGHSVAHAAGDFSGEDDEYYRELHEASRDATARDYSSVRPVYQLGYLAGRNPDYKGRAFTDIEPELQRGWTAEQVAHYGDWQSVRRHVGAGYERSIERQRAR